MTPRYALEKPDFNRHSPSKTEMEFCGWMHRGDGYPVASVRLCIGSRYIDCQQTMRRDLIGISPGGIQIQDARIGFRAKFTTRPGLKWVQVQHLESNGKWVTVARRLLRVPKIRSKSPTSSQNPTIHHCVPKTNRTPIFTNGKKRTPVSIVMPTYNRADTLAEVVRTTQRLCADYVFEWIIIDDGSTDHTSSVLEALARETPNLRFESIRNGGPGRARNIGAAMARHDVILFMGDDILPSDEDFLRPHAEMHAEHETSSLAVLGKVVWPDNGRLSVSPVMRHIQGKGGEQFGYADFTPNSFYDWRFFYTCNVSMKRGAVGDWLTDGFSDRFPFAAFEDGELAYRLEKKLGAFRVFYSPASCAQHLHPYTVAGFLRRQECAGTMAHTLLEIHPETLPLLGIADIQTALQAAPPGKPNTPTADYLALIEGIKAWARILEYEGLLGNEAWHDELLHAVFEMAYLQGYVAFATKAHSNHAKAYATILQRAKIRIGRIVESELTADPRFKSALLGLG